MNRFHVTLNTDFENEKFKYADLGSRDYFWVKPLTYLSKSASLLRTLLINFLAYKRSLRRAEWLCLNDKSLLTTAFCQKYGFGRTNIKNMISTSKFDRKLLKKWGIECNNSKQITKFEEKCDTPSPLISNVELKLVTNFFT